MNKIILYIATSQDGFIADKNGGVDWLPNPQDDAEIDVTGYKELMSRTDTILMGSNSYEKILEFGEWGWKDKQTYIFTSNALKSDQPYIIATHDSPTQLVTKLKAGQSEKDIWLLGGAKLAQSFHQEGLIDEVILTIVPQTLEEGIPLGLNQDNLKLTQEKSLSGASGNELMKIVANRSVEIVD